MATSKKKVNQIGELRAMDAKALQVKLAELRKELVDHAKANAARELPSTAVIRKTRKAIARVLTLLKEKQLDVAKDSTKIEEEKS